MSVTEGSTATDNKSRYATLRQWLTTETGHQLLKYERKRLARTLPDLFGYHIVQIGEVPDAELINSSRIQHKLTTASVVESSMSPDLLCDSHALPVATESIDVLLMPHVLEFSGNPHQILREAERVLIGEGHVVILGFNPWSLWGVWRLLLAWRDQFPWCGRYIRLSRLKDWLDLLDFEIISSEHFFFRPPLQNRSIMQKLEFLEYLGRYCWPYLGGIYMVVARKRVASLTPIKLRWQSRRHMLAAGIIEPSARNTSTEQQ